MPRISFDSMDHTNHVVDLGGTDYEFPGDPPIPLIVQLEQAVKALLDVGVDGATEDHVTAIYDALLGLFQVCDPALERLPVGTKQLVPLAVAVMNPEQYITAEKEADPTVPQPQAGTPKKTSSAPKAKKSRKTTRTSSS